MEKLYGTVLLCWRVDLSMGLVFSLYHETVIIMGVMFGERHSPCQLNTLCGDLENE
jgi:hypothetical protein